MNDFGKRLEAGLLERQKQLLCPHIDPLFPLLQIVRAANTAKPDSAPALESRLSSVSQVETPIAPSGAGVDLKNALFTLRESELNDDPGVTLFSEERRAILAHIEEQARKIAELEQRIYDNTFPF